MVKGEVENPGLQIVEGSISLKTTKNNIQNEGDKLLKIKDTNTNISPSISPSTNDYFPTIFDAIRSSGGITQYSDLSKIKIIRKNSMSNGGGTITTTINFEEVLSKGDSSKNIRIQDEDIIIVNRKEYPNPKLLQQAISSRLSPRFLNVFVAGRVNSPGNIKISSASVLSDAIDIAGGAKFVRGPVTFIRINNDGSIDRRKFGYKRRSKRGSYKNPTLREGDLIVIGPNALSNTNEVLTEITSPFLGIFSTYSLIKALND